VPQREAGHGHRGGGLRSAPSTLFASPAGLVACAAAALLLAFASACGTPAAPPRAAPQAALPLRIDDSSTERLLDSVERRTFDFFWETANPKNGLIPDRFPTPSFCSIAAVGFALTAYPIGVERGYVSREAARDRTLTTLQFFAGAPRGAQGTGVTGHFGFFYHFLDMETGLRFETIELSTIDTALLLSGALFCASYFDRDDPSEAAIRGLADRLYRDADWTALAPRPPLVSHGWTPEEAFNSYDWRGYDEAMILYILALGSPTHPIASAAWPAWTSTYRWASFQGQEYVTFAPLFGYQYSPVWIDFRGIQDSYMRGRGIDYFENSRRAVYAQRAYAAENPEGWRDYGPDIWGLTACDGPVDGDFTVDGRRRTFHTYWARGVAPGDRRDDGTIAPTAAAASLPFAPEIVLPAIAEMERRYGESLFGRYGFFDAFNPTFRLAVPVRHGRVVPGIGWVDGDWLGIDQGPILAMIENARTELVWKAMRHNTYIVSGLRRAGFTGGWLASAP
jgi:hypothetical protein